MLYNKKHICMRSPMRISFAGGGTDLESYYLKQGNGHVVSTTIDLYAYVSIKDMFDANVRIHHAEIETESNVSRIKHNYVRTALEHFGLFRGVEVVLTSDIMTTGSGLGASSAMMSSLALGCSDIQDLRIGNPTELAEKTYALECESETFGGKQDQYAVTFGGFNSISFYENTVRVEKLNIPDSSIKDLEDRLFLIYTNLARNSKLIQTHLNDNIGSQTSIGFLDKTLALSYSFKEALQAEKLDSKLIGEMLHEGWLIKKQANNQTTNIYIDQLYADLRSKGILGGKILGAGGGGFLLAFASSKEMKEKIKYDLYPNFIALDLRFTNKGTEILWKNY